jgi:hypothetical protein
MKNRHWRPDSNSARAGPVYGFGHDRPGIFDETPRSCSRKQIGKPRRELAIFHFLRMVTADGVRHGALISIGSQPPARSG